jgi:hypothetical protein
MVSKKRRPPRAIFYDALNVKAEDYKDSEQLKTLLNKEIPLAIFDAVHHRRNSALVFEINNSSNYLEIKKEYWAKALDWCLPHYVELEDYKTCSEIKSIIEKLTP